MSARKPAWVKQLDEREKSIHVHTGEKLADIHYRLTSRDEELCRVARVVAEAERSRYRLSRAVAALGVAVAILAILAVLR